MNPKNNSTETIDYEFLVFLIYSLIRSTTTEIPFSLASSECHHPSFTSSLVSQSLSRLFKHYTLLPPPSPMFRLPQTAKEESSTLLICVIYDDQTTLQRKKNYFCCCQELMKRYSSSLMLERY